MRVVLAVEALVLADEPLDVVSRAELLTVAVPLAVPVTLLPDPFELELCVEAEPLPFELELLDAGGAASGLRQLSHGPYASPLSWHTWAPTSPPGHPQETCAPGIQSRTLVSGTLASTPAVDDAVEQLANHSTPRSQVTLLPNQGSLITRDLSEAGRSHEPRPRRKST